MRRTRSGFALLGISFLMLAVSAVAAPAGTIKTVKGEVSVERQSKKLPVAPGFSVQAGDRIVTGSDGLVGIVLRDRTSLTAGPNSTLDLDKYVFNPNTHAGEMSASVKRGSLAVISGKLAKGGGDRVRFNTRSMTLGVRGTEFVIEAGTGESR